MLIWNLISVILVILTLLEAGRNSGRLPKFASWATVSLVWFIGSITLFYLNQTA